MPSPAMRRIALLGSTGSIGRNTLDVVAHLPERFQVVALAAGTNVEVMAGQIERFRPRMAAMRTPELVAGLRRELERRSVPVPELHAGEEGLRLAATAAGADLLVAATVGIAALEAIAAALRQGCTVALANKEALVVAGALLLAEACRSGAVLLPIDSEHSAIHQCLRGGEAGEVDRIILTASGGPLLRRETAELDHISPEEALRHPTWSMGARISLDSATLMNKGFEVIEACHLFAVDEKQVEVLIHPQSIVHSLVEFTDGSMMAQMGAADMRIPIQYALTYPDRLRSPRKRLKLEVVGKLEFELPDLKRFPCLRLARDAYRAGGGATAVLNAADEIATAAFLDRRIGFSTIALVVERSLEHFGAPSAGSLEAVLQADREARRYAAAVVNDLGR